MKPLLFLLMTVGVRTADRQAVADAIHRAHPPSAEIVAAIIEHESHGARHVCREDHGGSSRGLMQILRPDSRCSPEDDARFASDYDPATNVRTAIRLLAVQKGWHLKHCKHPHDVLEHFAGKGPEARRFAKDIRKRARELRCLKEKAVR